MNHVNLYGQRPHLSADNNKIKDKNSFTQDKLRTDSKISVYTWVSFPLASIPSPLSIHGFLWSNIGNLSPAKRNKSFWNMYVCAYLSCCPINYFSSSLLQCRHHFWVHRWSSTVYPSEEPRDLHRHIPTISHPDKQRMCSPFREQQNTGTSIQFVYPAWHPDLEELGIDIVAALAEAVEKYEVYPAMNICWQRMK